MSSDDCYYSTEKACLMQAISKALDMECSGQLRGAYLLYLQCVLDSARLLLLLETAAGRPVPPPPQSAAAAVSPPHAAAAAAAADRSQLLALCHRCLERLDLITSSSATDPIAPAATVATATDCGDDVAPSAPSAPVSCSCSGVEHDCTPSSCAAGPAHCSDTGWMSPALRILSPQHPPHTYQQSHEPVALKVQPTHTGTPADTVALRPAKQVWGLTAGDSGDNATNLDETTPEKATVPSLAQLHDCGLATHLPSVSSPDRTLDQCPSLEDNTTQTELLSLEDNSAQLHSVLTGCGASESGSCHGASFVATSDTSGAGDTWQVVHCDEPLCCRAATPDNTETSTGSTLVYSSGLYSHLLQQLHLVDTSLPDGGAANTDCSDIRHPLIAIENPDDGMPSDSAEQCPLDAGHNRCQQLIAHYTSRLGNTPRSQHHSLRLELQRRLAEVRVTASKQHQQWLTQRRLAHQQYHQQASQLLARCSPAVSQPLLETCRSVLAETLHFEQQQQWAARLRQQLQLVVPGSDAEASGRALHAGLLHLLLEKSHPVSRLRQRLQFSLYCRMRPLVEQHARLLSDDDGAGAEGCDTDSDADSDREQRQREEAFRRHLRNIVADVQEGVATIGAVLTAAVPALAACRPLVDTATRSVLCTPLWPHLLVLYRLVNLRLERRLAKVMYSQHHHHHQQQQLQDEQQLLMLEVPEEAKSALRQMLLASCPEQKCALLVRAVKLLCVCSAQSLVEPCVGADELLPRLTALVLWSRSPQLPSELQYIDHFLADQAHRGERGYCLTSLQTVVMYLVQQ